jgi:hypothetical protein
MVGMFGARYFTLLPGELDVLSTMLYQNCTTAPRSFQLSAWLPSTSISTFFVYGFTYASSSNSSGSVKKAYLYCVNCNAVATTAN